MDSRQRSIEVSDIYQITSGAAIDILQFEEDIQEIIFRVLSDIGHPGEGVYDRYALNIDDGIVITMSIFGDEDGLFTMYEIDEIHDMDMFLDYINLNRAIVWNTSTMTSRRL